MISMQKKNSADRNLPGKKISSENFIGRSNRKTNEVTFIFGQTHFFGRLSVLLPVAVPLLLLLQLSLNIFEFYLARTLVVAVVVVVVSGDGDDDGVVVVAAVWFLLEAGTNGLFG